MQLNWLLLAIALAFDGLFMAAVISKYREVSVAKRWISAPGKVVSSRSEARKVTRTSSDSNIKIADSEIRNFAAIAFEFATPAGVQRGTRLSLSEDLGDYQVEEKLKRYPKGAVVTVFYDPSDPKKSALERDFPDGMFKTAIMAGAAFALFAVAVFLASIGWFERPHTLSIRSEHGSAALFLCLMAVFAALFGLTLHRRRAAVRRWPRVSGKIASSEVASLRARFGGPGSPSIWRTVFRSRTVYNYSVRGIAYQSDRISFGFQAYASFRLWARREAGRYAPGDAVQVWHDPANPAVGVLDPEVPGIFVIPIVAAALFGMAAWLVLGA